jgi:phage shock protein C
MEKRKLFRSKTDRVFFGVCGGLGEYFDVDSSIIRLIFVILAVWGGIGVLLYIVCIFLFPEEGTNKNSDTKADIKDRVEDVASEIKETIKRRPSTRGDLVVGLVVLLLGIIFLFQNIFSWLNIWKLWPVFLVLIGLVMIASSSKKEKK